MLADETCSLWWQPGQENPYWKQYGTMPKETPTNGIESKNMCVCVYVEQCFQGSFTLARRLPAGRSGWPLLSRRRKAVVARYRHPVCSLHGNSWERCYEETQARKPTSTSASQVFIMYRFRQTCETCVKSLSNALQAVLLSLGALAGWGGLGQDRTGLL